MASTHQLKVQDIFSVKDYVCLVWILFEKSLFLSAPFLYFNIDLEEKSALLANIFGVLLLVFPFRKTN